MTSHTVLLAYARVGAGHEQAARALGEVFEQQGWSTSYVDFLDEVPAPMRFVMRDAYLQLVNILPEAYDLAFQHTMTQNLREAEASSRLLSNVGYTRLRNLALAEAPDAIVSTNMWPTLVLAKVKRHRLQNVPLINVFTDYVLQTLYMANGVSWHVSANEELTATFLTSHRHVRQPIYPLGIPVRPAFAVHHTRRGARHLLGIPAEGHVALVMGGGLGLGNMVEVCDTLTSTVFPAPVTVVALCGDNTGVLEEIRTLAAARSPTCTILPIGWTDQVATWMEAADVLITKAGGVTMAEAAAVGVPLIIFQPLPGQEAVNVRFLAQRRAAIAADNADELVRATQDLMFTAQGAKVAGNLRRLGRPNAARDIVARVIDDACQDLSQEESL